MSCFLLQQSYSRAIASSTEGGSLADFKKILSEIIPLASKYPSKMLGNFYVIQSIEGVGIHWLPVPSDTVIELGNLGISVDEKLEVMSFKKVKIINYYNDIILLLE